MKTDVQMEIMTYLTYLAKPFLVIKTLLFTSKGLAITIPTSVTIAALSSESKAWYLFLLVYTVDFITGIMASYYLNFKEEKKKHSYAIILESRWSIRMMFKIEFFIANIQSEKLRKSIIKAVGYTLFILLFHSINHVFQIKSWSFESVSDLKWNLTLVALAGCIASEIWSILFENLKKMGFDLIGILGNLSGTYKEVKKKMKDDEEV